jgi:hypothetical protein
MALKNLKSLFFVEEEKPEETPPQNQKSPPLPVQQVPVTPPPLPANASLDQRIFDSLEKALETSNLQGFDYFEFRSSLRSLVAIIPDEATRFKAVFATALASGVTVQKLLESGNFYKDVLVKEQEKFQAALSSQVDVGVVAKQKEAEKLTALIQQKSEEIKRLTLEIQQHQEEITKLQTAVTEANAKIEITKNNFIITYQTVMDQISRDLVNIERYLK